MPQNQQVLLDNRPSGEASTSNFKLVTGETPPLKDGQVLVRNHYLSVDPYMRGRMNEGKSYAKCQVSMVSSFVHSANGVDELFKTAVAYKLLCRTAEVNCIPQQLDFPQSEVIAMCAFPLATNIANPLQELGKVMVGGTVGEIVESKSPDFAVGDMVSVMGGWQQYSVISDPKNSMAKIDISSIPLSYHLGVMGMPGATAWVGLMEICKMKAGETVVVSSASGAVGSVVGQLAKSHGCRVIGFAGGPEKCRYVTDELGFDACIDYKLHRSSESIVAALNEHAPDGIDCDFENVGGMILDAVMDCMNPFGRVAICGMISGYNGEPQPMSKPMLILSQRLTVKGFICSDYLQQWPQAWAEIGELIKAGKMKYRESVAEGLEAAPEALLGVLKGKNFGKQVVKLV